VFQSTDDNATGLGGRDAAEARYGLGQVAQDVANGHGPVGEQDVGEVMFGQHARGDGAGSFQTRQSCARQGLWVTLGLRVLDCILKIDVRVWGAVARAGHVEAR